MTVEEYLAIKREADCKSEYYEGQMFAMAGGTGTYADPAGRLNQTLRNNLDVSCCTVYTSDLKIQIEPGGLHAYPDLTVVCAEPVFTTATGDVLANPKLVVGILSPFTEAHDRSFKFQQYQKDLIAGRVRFRVAGRTPRRALLAATRFGLGGLCGSSREGATITLKSLGLEIRVEEIYRPVKFAR